ncbi:MAG: type II toxin-antitoxin system VapC family toxin [Akkermansiaceae bacterium]|jgi:PIN domain nuclease of toxin-antitoxin system|nr:type II toxin-antitoxin system VapC family toxin [Luteolibacter sp.]
MRLLLDTHTILWYIFGDSRLSSRARDAILTTDEVYWSMVSIWEIGIKQSLGKPGFELPADWARFLPEQMSLQGFSHLPIDSSHCEAVSKLHWYHRDPFDRLLIATAKIENLTIVSRDTSFQKYPIDQIW